MQEEKMRKKMQLIDEHMKRKEENINSIKANAKKNTKMHNASKTNVNLFKTTNEMSTTSRKTFIKSNPSESHDKLDHFAILENIRKKEKKKTEEKHEAAKKRIAEYDAKVKKKEAKDKVLSQTRRELREENDLDRKLKKKKVDNKNLYKCQTLKELAIKTQNQQSEFERNQELMKKRIQ